VGKGALVDQAAFNNVARYTTFMEIVQSRRTTRAFAPFEVPREHFEMILEAARHAPSGANSQPWHYIVVTDPAVKQKIGECFVQEQQRRARLRMGFPTPNYNGVKTAPGLIVVADFRFVRAFPILNDGSVWWITAIGQEDIQRQIKPLLGVPEELAIIDVMCFGPPLKPPYKRWKKSLDQILSWDRFNPGNFMTDAQIDAWVKETRHKVMYRDESRID